MKKNRLSELCVLTVVAIVIVAVALFYSSPRSRIKNGPRIQSYAHLKAIGLALRDYRDEHDGRLPTKLSELVPRYVAVSNLAIFYGTTAKARAALPTDWNSNPRLIDAWSSFSYRAGSNSVLAIERADLWKNNDASWMAGQVAVLFDDYRVAMTPLSQVQPNSTGTNR